MNRVTLIGNCGGPPELKASKTGTSYCTFRMATSHRQKDGTYVPTWHNIKIFGKTADLVGPMIKKGSKLFIDGSLNYNEYTDKAGVKKSFPEVIAFHVNVIMRTSEQPQAHEPPSYDDSQSMGEMDIPF